MENVSKFVTTHMVATGALVKLGTDWNLMASAAVVRKCVYKYMP